MRDRGDRTQLRGVFTRGWLAAALAALTIVGAGLRGRAEPLPPYGAGYAIIDQQMRRSHRIGAADIVFVGDSATLYGVDPRIVAAGLGGARVQSLAAIGPARPPGYAKLLANYLVRHPAPPAAVFVLHPLGLIDASPPSKQTEMRAVLDDRWKRAPFAEGARQALNGWLFGGWLEEPLEGAHGRYYGNATMLERALRAGDGGLVNPATSALKTPPSAAAHGATYTLHPDGRRDLLAAGALLHGLDTSRLYVGLAPVPASLAADPEAASRAALLATTLELLGLPADHGLELPRSFPNPQFVDLTHLGADGRRDYSQQLVPVLRNLLGTAART